jgi:hypothetical protein
MRVSMMYYRSRLGEDTVARLRDEFHGMMRSLADIGSQRVSDLLTASNPRRRSDPSETASEHPAARSKAS